MAACPTLRRLLGILETIAPLRLAGTWDNVGLLVDVVDPLPPSPSILLTNDLTPAVLDEAISRSVNVIITYHPTPFSSMKKFRMGDHPARVVLTAARKGIAVYSPHTALDCVPGGINDWLVQGIVGALPGSVSSTGTAPVKEASDPEWAAQGAGDGRIIRGLHPAPSLTTLVAAVKSHLGLSDVRVALPASMTPSEMNISSFGVCAGSGASILSPIAGKVDLLVTGEMSHHEILAATYAGSAVIITNHSNCERGYLPTLAASITRGWGEATLPPIIISSVDADPLVTM